MKLIVFVAAGALVVGLPFKALEAAMRTAGTAAGGALQYWIWGAYAVIFALLYPVVCEYVARTMGIQCEEWTRRKLWDEKRARAGAREQLTDS